MEMEERVSCRNVLKNRETNNVYYSLYIVWKFHLALHGVMNITPYLRCVCVVSGAIAHASVHKGFNASFGIPWGFEVILSHTL